MEKVKLKNICILLLPLLIFTSCARYEVRRYDFLLDRKGPQWLVYRNDFYIPEYTQTGKGEFAATEEEARRLFYLRRPVIDPLLWKKYERPKWHAFDYMIGAEMFVLGPVLDIFYMPTYWLAKAFHKNIDNNDLGGRFPFTQMGISAVFYGPAAWEILGPVSLTEKESWKQNPELEKNLQNILREKQ